MPGPLSIEEFDEFLSYWEAHGRDDWQHNKPVSFEPVSL